MTADPATLVFEGIVKRFPGVTALGGIDLACRGGEVHVLLGENGAGKSTLVALLAGVLRPDAGAIRIDGRAVSLATPRRALAEGIGVLFQHPVLAPSLRVVDAIALGPGPAWRRIPRRALAAELRALAADAGLPCDPWARSGDLSLGERQQVGVMQALLRGTRILVLDEVTATLTPDGAAAMGALMRRVAQKGITVLWITHRIDEALTHGDRITVLRHGRVAGVRGPAELAQASRADNTAAILALMFGTAARSRSGDADATSPPDAHLPSPLRRGEGGEGRDRPTSSYFTRPPRLFRPSPLAPLHKGEGDMAEAPAALEVRDLAVADPRQPVQDLSFAVAAGEIFGIAGIDGNGQRTLAEALAGQRQPAGGAVHLEGHALDGLGVEARRALGLGYATDDRLGEGTIGGFSVALNLLLKDVGHAPFWRRGLARPQAIAAEARERIAAFDIRTPDAATAAGTLSGGNIQKLLLARELSRRMRVAILAKPTHGLDARNTRAIRARIRAAAEAGVAIVLISADLDEVLDLADRIAVMADGRFRAVLPNGAGAAEAVGRLMGSAAA